MRKGGLYAISFLAIFILAFSLKKYSNKEFAPSHAQADSTPWETLSYSMPVEMSIFSSIDSIPWEITDQPTLDWFYKNFNDIYITYEAAPTQETQLAFSDSKAIYMLIACENGDGLSLQVSSENKLLVSDNTTIAKENIKTPPAGIYSIDSVFDFTVLWDISRKQQVP